MKPCLPTKHNRGGSHWLIFALLVLIALGAWYIHWTARQADAALRQRLLIQATGVARQVSPESINRLAFDESDRANPHFQRLCSQMKAYAMEVLPQFGPKTKTLNTYSITRRGEDFLFGPESIEPGTAQASPPGTRYLKPPLEVGLTFSDCRSQSVGPYTDEYGTFVSAFAPVIDPRSGEVLLVVGMDVDAAEWNRELINHCIEPLIYTLMMVGVLLSAAWLANRRFTGGALSRYATIFPVAIGGLVLSLVIARVAQKIESRQHHETFLRLADAQIRRVQNWINDFKGNELEGLARYFENNPEVSREKFHAYADYLTREPAVQAWEWIPLVASNERQHFEGVARADGIVNFEIWEKDANGNRVAVADRPYYYPISCVEPLAANDVALGYDLGSDPVRRSALEQAGKTKIITASEPVTLIQETNRQKGLLVVRPVYDRAETNQLRGFALGLLRLHDLLHRTAGVEAIHENNLVFIQMNWLATDSRPTPLATTYSASEMDPSRGERADAPAYSAPLFAFGQTYGLVARPTQLFAELYPAQATIRAGLVGVGTTIMVTILVALVGRKRRELEQEVQMRTDELHASEQRLSLALEGAELGTWDWHIPSGKGKFNHRWAEMLGYRLDEIIPRVSAWENLVHPEDFPLVRSLLEKHINGLTPVYESEHRLRHKSGEWIWILDRGKVIERDKNGKSIRACGTHLDITQRKREEATVRQTLLRRQLEAEVVAKIAVSPNLESGDIPALTREVTESAARTLQVERVGVWLFEAAETQMVEVESFVSSSNQYSVGSILLEHQFRNEFAALKTAKFVDAHEAQTDPRTIGYAEGYLKPNGITSMLDAVIRSGGRNLGVLCFEHVNQPHRWEDDEISFACQLADQMALAITLRERRLAVDQARKLARAVEQSPAIIMITDLKGNIEYVNNKFIQVTGYSTAEVKGKTPRLLKSNETSLETYRELWKTIQSGREWRGVFHNRKKNGDLFWESASIFPITDAAGKPTHYLAAKEDITERKRIEADNEKLENQLRQAQKMEAIGQLAGGIAHDFNNIVASLMLHLDMLQLKPDLDFEMRAELAEMDAGARRAANLTKQLLMFSRQSVLTKQPLEINLIINNLLKMLSRLIPENVQLRFEDWRAGVHVVADVGLLEQVLINLVLNARDAMPRGGSITIATERIEITAEFAHQNPERRAGYFACLTVADTGCGMSPEILKRVFDPFFTTKETGKGTGLGLATVSGIVAQHDGWVEAQSEVGKGSTFKIYLPSLEGQITASLQNGRTSGDHPAIGGKEMILVVEDDERVRKIVCRTLRRLGYQIHEASDGPDALRLWPEIADSVNLLLTDMVMTQSMTGLDLAEQLRKQKPALKVIVSSGYSADMIQEGSPERAGVAYLAKPYSSDLLAETIRKCLDGSI